MLGFVLEFVLLCVCVLGAPATLPTLLSDLFFLVIFSGLHHGIHDECVSPSFTTNLGKYHVWKRLNHGNFNHGNLVKWLVEKVVPHAFGPQNHET